MLDTTCYWSGIDSNSQFQEFSQNAGIEFFDFATDQKKVSTRHSSAPPVEMELVGSSVAFWSFFPGSNTFDWLHGGCYLNVVCARGVTSVGVVVRSLGAKVPFILIPGLTVPTLEAKFDVKSTPHFYCPKHSQDYKPIYLVTDDGYRNSRLLHILCSSRWERRHLRFCRACLKFTVFPYRNTVAVFSNASGVDVRAPGFGLLSSMLYFRIAGKEVPIYRDFANNMTAAGWELDVTARVRPMTGVTILGR